MIISFPNGKNREYRSYTTPRQLYKELSEVALAGGRAPWQSKILFHPSYPNGTTSPASAYIIIDTPKRRWYLKHSSFHDCIEWWLDRANWLGLEFPCRKFTELELCDWHYARSEATRNGK